MRRRLKNEVTQKHLSKKAIQELAQQDFTGTLVKLSDVVKSRVRVSEFTNKDKINLMDLFVNHERTLLKMYEVLFSIDGVNLTRIGQLKNLSDEITIQSSLKPQQFAAIDDAYIKNQESKVSTIRTKSDLTYTRNINLAHLSLPQPHLHDINADSGQALIPSDLVSKRPVKLRQFI